jgi:Uma2 family endonuclease
MVVRASLGAIMATDSQPVFGVHYTVPRSRAGWELEEGMMPESVPHDEAVALLKALLGAWAAREREGAALVVRNLAIRWVEAEPRVGVDPDVCVLSPPPPDARELRSVRTWLPGHAPPILAVEVVSETNPRKDYSIGPDKYAASGTGELWVFDPLLSGPATAGGPFRLQIWHRRDGGALVRIYAGAGPARSPTLGVVLLVTDGGRRLRLADDERGAGLWQTAEEAALAAKDAALSAKDAALSAKDAALAAKDAALARVAELEAALAARGSTG